MPRGKWPSRKTAFIEVNCELADLLTVKDAINALQPPQGIESVTVLIMSNAPGNEELYLLLYVKLVSPNVGWGLIESYMKILEQRIPAINDFAYELEVKEATVKRLQARKE